MPNQIKDHKIDYLNTGRDPIVFRKQATPWHRYIMNLMRLQNANYIAIANGPDVAVNENNDDEMPDLVPVR